MCSVSTVIFIKSSLFTCSPESKTIQTTLQNKVRESSIHLKSLICHQGIRKRLVPRVVQFSQLMAEH